MGFPPTQLGPAGQNPPTLPGGAAIQASNLPQLKPGTLQKGIKNSCSIFRQNMRIFILQMRRVQHIRHPLLRANLYRRVLLDLTKAVYLHQQPNTNKHQQQVKECLKFHNQSNRHVSHQQDNRRQCHFSSNNHQHHKSQLFR